MPGVRDGVDVAEDVTVAHAGELLAREVAALDGAGGRAGEDRIRVGLGHRLAVVADNAEDLRSEGVLVERLVEVAGGRPAHAHLALVRPVVGDQVGVEQDVRAVPVGVAQVVGVPVGAQHDVRVELAAGLRVHHVQRQARAAQGVHVDLQRRLVQQRLQRDRGALAVNLVLLWNHRPAAAPAAPHESAIAAR